MKIEIEIHDDVINDAVQPLRWLGLRTPGLRASTNGDGQTRAEYLADNPEIS